MSFEILETYEGDAVIVHGEVRVQATVRFQVDRDLVDVRSRDGHEVTLLGLTGWRGTYVAGGPLPFDRSGMVLELPDGRTGRILIASINAVDVTAIGSSGRGFALGGSGEFVGDGAPPRIASATDGLGPSPDSEVSRGG